MILLNENLLSLEAKSFVLVTTNFLSDWGIHFHHFKQVNYWFSVWQGDWWYTGNRWMNKWHQQRINKWRIRRSLYLLFYTDNSLGPGRHYFLFPIPWESSFKQIIVENWNEAFIEMGDYFYFHFTKILVRHGCLSEQSGVFSCWMLTCP